MAKGGEKAERELNLLKQRYAALVEDAPQEIIELDKEGKILYANRKALSFAGRAKGKGSTFFFSLPAAG